MANPPENYKGREQAYIKHYLLRNYFSRLIHKVAGAFQEFTYVDGFSGPWQSSSDTFSDTSFGIALEEMRKAKQAWANHGHHIRMRALLVEKNAQAFAKLTEVPERYPDIEITPLRGDFVTLVPALMNSLSFSTFTFLFIDPKGWGINTSEIVPLLRRPNTEILFNFMFDFINRAISMNDSNIVSKVNNLITTTSWRERLLSAPSEERRSIILEAFAQTLRDVGGYSFVAETPILRPSIDRHIYSLVYATRHRAGVKEFRDAQQKTIEEQEIVRDGVKMESRSGSQTELFSSAEMKPSAIAAFIEREAELAEQMLLALIGSSATDATAYGEIWPQVLSRRAITHAELNKLVAKLRRSKTILSDHWMPRQRVPTNASLLYRNPDMNVKTPAQENSSYTN
ncbi:three-Cys-motif partner protein TcmP [Falsiroseomonas stagni]|uniref:Three-Cys-motif partner protein n=1 Tax=Falsiroseomonas stagni DSM 19981 TaxID=1123062 RepID=A0A1I3YD69_9PROT|nr:three-Cys-motif partner protein TcmP [Falsiroseomonas stagni]SFK29126.1 three-Cys-motif partner protein [Falsiroseomonas stagni DSM 19981]